MQFHRALALAVVLPAFTILPAHAAPPDDLACSKKTVVTYHPGSNWPHYPERFSAHLEFVKARLADGSMAYGAPVSDASGAPVGGLYIYNGTDLDQVEAAVQEDAFVKDGVVTFSVVAWDMCRRKDKQD
jgi:uncharacterized protein YciI